MSGFIGWVNCDGRPAETELLRSLTASMAYRAPDSCEIFTDGFTALGHALLNTSPARPSRLQPLSLDANSWIVADCRIDDRESLTAELAARGCRPAPDCPDAELILHAWSVWQADCLLHLTGDFAFAIWDSRARRLFCARDHLGVKLLYFAQSKNRLIVSNTLATILRHPAVDPAALNENVIGDYLLFGYHLDTSETFFRDIKSLPAAHTLDFSEGKARIARYWSLPVDPPLRLRHRGDYAERFLELLERTTRDRLRTDRLSVLMSGGLDSSGLAAMAKKIASTGDPLEIHAHTCVYDTLIPDEERHFSQLAASHLGISIRHHGMDEEHFFEVFETQPYLQRPGPAHINLLGPDRRAGFLAAVARDARVAFYGEGPDNALDYEPGPYFRYEWKHGQLGSLIRDLVEFPFIFGTLPLAGRFRASSKSTPKPPDFPAWLNPDFVARTSLADRWSGQNQPAGMAGSPVRPGSWGSFQGLEWAFILEGLDPGVTGVPLEIRHPYLDIRLLRFMLSVPALPWCRDKYLMRLAFRRLLPKPITDRPKKPLGGSPSWERWKISGLPPMPGWECIEPYIDSAAIQSLGIDSNESLGVFLRVAGLTFFLRNLKTQWHNKS